MPIKVHFGSFIMQTEECLCAFLSTYLIIPPAQSLSVEYVDTSDTEKHIYFWGKFVHLLDISADGEIKIEFVTYRFELILDLGTNELCIYSTLPVYAADFSASSTIPLSCSIDLRDIPTWRYD